ncbi:trans-sulfuration enzyme family protein [Nocardioides nematodiphilus]|uniref:trans-sulfuration enzyme family protein n=1 Tax=Nocardioides nematodiphilus TaxID=2849669 RepID=UPI001CD9B01E|nr:PLP-dependent transferase [Nocardioides nematodiphilus]MCA1984455.1 PLP-dependent transferase [Nocardioides nematodiphilus]
MADQIKPATVAVHAGRPPREIDQALNVPITMASTYVAGGDKEYGRYANDTWSAFEEALGALEGGKALTFASGLSAVATILDLVNDSVVVAGQSYQGTIGQLADLEARGRLTARLVDITDTAGVVAALDDDVALLWIESPTNPGMALADLPALIAAAHDAGVQVVVDNTFATPLLQQPLALGADIVVHSATKYLAGHSDAVMGAIVVPDTDEGRALWDVLKGRRDLIGAIPGTMEAWLALRGLRTLSLRVERAAANAADLAARLAEHPAVEEVRYPGFGGMLAIVLRTAEAAEAVTHATDLWVHATSLGGVESTFERRRRWKTEDQNVPEGLIRLSVGIEDVDDLWADLAGALDRL